MTDHSLLKINHLSFRKLTNYVPDMCEAVFLTEQNLYELISSEVLEKTKMLKQLSCVCLCIYIQYTIPIYIPTQEEKTFVSLPGVVQNIILKLHSFIVFSFFQNIYLFHNLDRTKDTVLENRNQRCIVIILS